MCTGARAPAATDGHQLPFAFFGAPGVEAQGDAVTVTYDHDQPEVPMFFRHAHLQYNAKPNRPDPLYARQLQEVLGGQWGEISVMMSYLFQGWNCRGPAKYRDMILDIGTEEIAHVEMLATMIARLLEKSPVEAREDAAKNSAIGAVLGGTNLNDVLLA